MKPGLYLTLLYSLLLLLLLFFLLFYKGLRDHGTYLRVSSLPSGAMVSVDGRYAGSTPCEILVRSGQRRVAISKPFFESQSLTDRFEGPVFGTLFVRPRRSWAVKLRLENPTGLVHQALKDFAGNPHIPEILTETIAAGYGGDEEVQKQLYDFLDKSKYFITSSMQLPAFLAAFTNLESNHRFLTVESLLNMSEKIVNLNQKYENFPFWMASVLPEDQAKKLGKIAWYQDFTTRFAATYRKQLDALKAQATPAPPSAYRFLGLTFHAIPAGTLMQGSEEEKNLAYQLPHPVKIKEFLMSETEVPVRVYQKFLQTVPQWRKDNLQSLIEQGLATETYLENWTGETYPAGSGDLPITGISWFAAQAFCRWLTTQLPTSLSGYEARLPTESEWEWAARGGIVGAAYPTGSKPVNEVFFDRGSTGPRPIGSSSPNGYGLRDMSGNVWEWCSDWFCPAAYLFTSWDPQRNTQEDRLQPMEAADKVVRGGSWANEKELVKVYTRASQPPFWCTPYLGFRIVLSKKSS